MSTRICAGCNNEFPLGEFVSHGPVIHAYCKKCIVPIKKAKKREQEISSKRKKTYGITREQYDKMRKEQNDSCAICGEHESNMRQRLAVDHCHETLKVRGLLCLKCNLGIGCLRDDINIINRAAEYLESHK